MHQVDLGRVGSDLTIDPLKRGVYVPALGHSMGSDAGGSGHHHRALLVLCFICRAETQEYI